MAPLLLVCCKSSTDERCGENFRPLPRREDRQPTTAQKVLLAVDKAGGECFGAHAIPQTTVLSRPHYRRLQKERRSPRAVLTSEQRAKVYRADDRGCDFLRTSRRTCPRYCVRAGTLPYPPHCS